MRRGAGAARPTLKLAVLQTAPRLRDLPGNAARLAAQVAAADADLAVTPELSLSGYDLGDSVHRLAVDVVPGGTLPGLQGLPESGDTLVGVVERARGGPYNTAVLLRGGTVAFSHRKIYLPTYGMFDEARWFGRGRAVEVCELSSGWRAGVLVCEDFWHPGLSYVLASRGIDLLLVQAAAPGRGVWEGGTHGTFASAEVWERIARTTAQLYAIYVVLANRVGVEGGVTFAGGSLVVDPTGAIVARGPDLGEAVLTAELSSARLEAARVPYSHERDDLARLVAEELLRAEPGR